MEVVMSNYFRKTLVAAVIAAMGLFGLVISCDDPNSPFSSSLGGKVDIAPPVILVGSPASGEYISGTARFTGEVGVYRDLRRVEVKIFDNERLGQPEESWSSEGIVVSAAPKDYKWTIEAKNRQIWTYELNTLLLNGGNGLAGSGKDGSVKIQFRAIDTNTKNNTTTTSELVYIVKNLPSEIKLTSPSHAEVENEIVARITTGEAIRGQITDRRGLKPGYPMIKLWPKYDPNDRTVLFNGGKEPDDDDEDWGWVSMFLPGTVDNLGVADDPLGGPNKQGTYADRSAMIVKRAVQFSFKLDRYTINKTTRQAVYEVNSTGDHVPLDPKKDYLFRIKTSDTFFDSETQFPRESIPNEDPVLNEAEIIGFFPYAPGDVFTAREDPAEIELISAEVPPTIDINNEDVPYDPSLPGTQPNIYIAEMNSKKIAVNRNGNIDFRLRVMAAHADSISRAVLQYNHISSGRSGFLKWKDVGGNYVNDTSEETRAEDGYTGQPAGSFTFTSGKVFVFEADGSLTDKNGDLIFTTSSEPYILTVYAWAVGGSTPAEKQFTLYMDGVGPTVNIRSMRAYSEPSGAGYMENSGGRIYDSTYIVNGNIWVTIDRSDDSGIKVDNGRPLVKWWVETIAPTANNPLSLLSKIATYRANPSAGRLEFFTDMQTTQNSGWVTPAESSGAPEEQSHNFKFNTFRPKVSAPADNDWDGRDLWVYVVAQDSVQNLGFTVQKITVNDFTDIPTLSVPGLFTANANGDPITGAGDLDVTVGANYVKGGNWSATTPPRNILEEGAGIELNFTDDDGIALTREDITITLTDLNDTDGIVNNPATLTTEQIVEIFKDSSLKERSGTLEQRIMADALYLNMDSPPEKLRNGMYKIDITITDDINSKVTIGEKPGVYPGDWPGDKSPPAVSYYFAVFNELPEIIIDTPEPNSLQNTTPIAIEGRVRSELKAQYMRITFTPDLTTPNKDASKTIDVDLYSDAGYTALANALEEVSKDADGKYTYYWRHENVNFDAGITAFDWRRFNMEVFDRLGNQNALERTVQVDKTPPEVTLFEFNYFRDEKNGSGEHIVNGKVPFTLTAQDDNGLEALNGYAGLKWWVLPTTAGDTNEPNWGTSLDSMQDGQEYHFRSVEEKNGGRFTGIIDTTGLVQGYTLWAMAKDKAGNTSAAVNIARIYVDQNSDKPRLDPNRLIPTDGNIVGGGLEFAISGTASDDDGFNGATPNKYVQIRFPATWNTNGTAISWGGDDRWIEVPGRLDQAGAINFSFRFADHGGLTAFGEYFNSQGPKYYQIRVTDEPAAGVNDRPPGKNPDAFKVNNSDFPNYAYSQLGAVSEIFPTAATGYHFILDSLKPVVFFNNYDPESSHQNHDSTNRRPTFKTATALAALLSGTVVEANLSSISYRYGTVTGNLTPEDKSGENHSWSVQATSTFTDAFIAAVDGPQSITIEALDAAGNTTSAVWQFSKDTAGPEIRFRIAEVLAADGDTKELSVVTGGVIEGTFFDVLSYIWEGAWNNPTNLQFEYRFDSSGSGDTTTAWETGSINAPTNGQRNNSAGWTVTVPSTLSDGEHTLDIKISDRADNEASVYLRRFIKDRATPVVMLPDQFTVVVGDTTYNGTTALSDVNQRVFSAAGDGTTDTDIVFTVKGTASDNNLTSLTAYISTDGAPANTGITATVTILPSFWANKAGAPLWTTMVTNAGGTYTYTSTDKMGSSNDASKRLSISPSSTPYQWDWTLNILEKDVKALRDADGSLDSDTVRRLITVTATDKANTSAGNDQPWYFYLDTKEPNLDYINLVETAGSETVFDNSDFNTIVINGTVNDTTKIKDVRFLISKWGYTANDNVGAWTYYQSGSWQVVAKPAVIDWINLGDPSNPQNAQSTVTVNLDSVKLNTSGYPYPNNMFNVEGKYRLELYVTDWSLGGTSGAGNPVTYTRDFYIDRRDVIVSWRNPSKTSDELERTYYNNATAKFIVAVGNEGKPDDPTNPPPAVPGELNPNTITSVTAVVKNANSVVVVTVPPSGIIERNDLNTGTLGMRWFEITPNMSGQGNGTHTLELTVTNGARRQATYGKTKRFTLDNTNPTVTIGSPAAENTGELLGTKPTYAGSMTIRGNAADSDSNGIGRIGSVAYYVANSANGNFAVPTVANISDITVANGWRFFDATDLDATSHILYAKDGTTPLLEINPGTFSWEISTDISEITADVDDTSQSIKYAYKTTAGVAGNLTWQGNKISTGPTAADEVYRLTVYLISLDEAGNHGSLETREFWLYPEGDRPIVTIINPTSNQLLNGEIKLTGTAADNQRVRMVWFRVLDNDTNAPFKLRVPSYALSTDPADNSINWNVTNGQQPEFGVSITPYQGTSSGGWYYAMNENDGPSITWSVTINANELGLDNSGDPIIPITIEVVAEDARFVDNLWTTSGNKFSRLKDTNASIVTVAPKFEHEEVAKVASASAVAGDWEDITNAHIRRRASYRVTVTHNAGLTAIRWRRPDNTWFNLLDTNDAYNQSGYASAIAAMDAANPLYNAATNPGIAAKATPSAPGATSYVITIDVNTSLLENRAYANGAIRYRVQLSATESSNTTPITINRDAYLPIDNIPPTAIYTHNPRLAGLQTTIGGEAGDSQPVGAAQRVVIWLSKGSGESRQYISFRERDNQTTPDSYPFESGGTVETTVFNGSAWVTGNVAVPKAYDATDTDGANYSSIVIDQNDPSGRNPKYGHPVTAGETIRMGWASGAKTLDRLWYAEIDSTKLIDGQKTVHYMVYDRAGNSRYYEASLVVMNNAPVIQSITLATDIRRSITQNQPALGGTAANYYSAKSGILDVFGTVSTDDNVNRANGILAVTTEVSGTARQVNFNVRNGVFALKVNTVGTPDSTLARNFRVEYVTHATKITALTNIKAGRVYIISEPDTANWAALGAPNLQIFERGLAFLAAVDGTAVENLGNGVAWELNTGYYTRTAGASGDTLNSNVPANIRVPDQGYTAAEYASATTAEFVYKSGAFGTTKGTSTTNTGSIIDFTPRFKTTGEFTNSDLADYPIPLEEEPASNWDISQDYSLFIVKVFDGNEDIVYADFTLLAVRVNNNDETQPYSQLYDINPKTEAGTIGPAGIGENRTMGGLWNTGTQTMNKPGHIEPRGSGSAQGGITSLTSLEMGGLDAATMPADYLTSIIETHWANPAAYLPFDTLSGKVVVRGYAEDDQRIGRVALTIGASTFNIIDSNTTTAAATTSPPRTGLLKIAGAANAGNITVNGQQIPRVYFIDTVDRERHRVEWAYIWDTETIPNTTGVGNVAVSVTAYNAHYTGANYVPANPVGDTAGATIAAANAITQTANSPFNSGFPTGLKKYNSITVQLRPYITSFARAAAYPTVRSSQGWYPMSRGETITVNGFNLGTGNANNTVTITLPGATGLTGNNFNGNINTRTFIVPAAARSSIQLGAQAATPTTTITPVRLSVTAGGTAYEAVNSLDSKLVSNNYWVQPWNTENWKGSGSDLWDDYPCVHIWRSGNAESGSHTSNTVFTEADTFRTLSMNGDGTGWAITDPSMTIDPTNGRLWSSHSEHGGGIRSNNNAGVVRNDGNTGTVKISSNRDTTDNMNARDNPVNVAQFIDPLINSHIYVRSTGAASAAEVWAAFSIIGRSGQDQTYYALGGVYMHGPGGTNPYLASGLDSNRAGYTERVAGSSTHYMGESTWYDASTEVNSNTIPAGNRKTATSPPYTDQFLSPHIVTHIAGAVEHIHVAYYDTKDGSIKYRYNLRDTPGTIGAASWDAAIPTPATVNGYSKQWTNLDGGFDVDDTATTTYASGGTGTINATTRVVNYTARNALAVGSRINAGQHNAIAVTNNGFPIVAYYDETNYKLKLAVSNSTAPILATAWTINENVIPADDLSHQGTGQYVSMRFDNTNNKIHIAAFNVDKRKLVYIRGRLEGSTFVNETVQVVDSGLMVGKWSSISLDEYGNPWITYMDESRKGAYGGAKLAFLNTRYNKAAMDMHGKMITNWETMQIPALYMVEDERLGLENFPTPNVTIASNATIRTNITWNAAVGYLSKNTGSDRYRIAYYVTR